MAVNHVTGVRADIAQVLERIRDISSRNKVFDHGVKVNETSDFKSIADSARHMLDKINSSQVETESLKDKYLAGDNNVSLAQVLVSTEKSKLAFEGLIVVRNRCLEAYKEIMNMPI